MWAPFKAISVALGSARQVSSMAMARYGATSNAGQRRHRACMSASKARRLGRSHARIRRGGSMANLHHAPSISLACWRVVGVMVIPPSIRAISSTRAGVSSAVMRDCVVPPFSALLT